MGTHEPRAAALALAAHAAAGAGFLLVAAALPGCESDEPWERAAVSGLVTVDGDPLPLGTVTFAPAAGTAGPKVSAAVADGFYSLPRDAGPAVGTARVSVVRRDPAMPGMQDERIIDDPGLIPANPLPPLPARYHDETELTAEIAPGANGVNFDLTTD